MISKEKFKTLLGTTERIVKIVRIKLTKGNFIGAEEAVDYLSGVVDKSKSNLDNSQYETFTGRMLNNLNMVYKNHKHKSVETLNVRIENLISKLQLIEVEVEDKD